MTAVFSDRDIKSVRYCIWIPFMYLDTVSVCYWTQKDLVRLTCGDADPLGIAPLLGMVCVVARSGMADFYKKSYENTLEPQTQ